MRLVINGEDHHLNVTNLVGVVSHFELDPHLVVTEVEGVIVDRTNWENTTVTDGMKIELVQFVGGG